LKKHNIASSIVIAFISSILLNTSALAATGDIVGPSGKTYASGGIKCGLHPIAGMSPFVNAGLYNPGTRDKATVSLNGSLVANVTFINPDATVWLANQVNKIVVAINKRATDSYSFDATPDPTTNQANVCLPDTTSNIVDTTSDIETTVVGNSEATITPGCANGKPFVNLFRLNSNVILNVSVNGTPLTQLSNSRPHTPVTLRAGLNVISVEVATFVTPHAIEYYVRDGGTGTCQ
jgi:hypothetical protein